MFVTVNAQVFGTRNAGEIYSLLFSAFALASVVGAKLTMALVASLGWSGIFKVLAGMGGTALGLLYLLKKEKAKPAPWE
jgi:predicted MFS family arabinose efflux permease